MDWQGLMPEPDRRLLLVSGRKPSQYSHLGLGPADTPASQAPLGQKRKGRQFVSSVTLRSRTTRGGGGGGGGGLEGVGVGWIL